MIRPLFCVLAAAIYAGVSVTSADAQVASVTADSLDPQADEIAVATIVGTGVQVYECKANAEGKLAWAFKEPRADLTVAGKSVGKHFAGPHWELDDGSRVKGQVVALAKAPADGDIPWLRLAIVENKGAGQLAGTVAILRTKTKGGTLAKDVGTQGGPCTDGGKLREEPYVSDYIFLKKK